MDKNFIDAQYSLACTKYDLDDYESAIADFTSIIKSIPDLQIAYTLRGSAYAALEDYKKAIVDYTSAIYINPDADAFLNRGVLFLDIKNYQKAKSDLSSAIRLNKTNPFLYFYRGTSSLFMGKYDHAIEDFLTALAFDSQDFEALLGLSMAYLKTNDLEQAKTYFKKAKSIVNQDKDNNSIDQFSKSYWYTKHYYYFKNSFDELEKF